MTSVEGSSRWARSTKLAVRTLIYGWTCGVIVGVQAVCYRFPAKLTRPPVVHWSSLVVALVLAADAYRVHFGHWPLVLRRVVGGVGGRRTPAPQATAPGDLPPDHPPESYVTSPALELDATKEEEDPWSQSQHLWA